MIAADKKTNFNNITFWNECDAQQQQALLQRPAVAASDSISASVAKILQQVKSGGDAALRELSAKFDKVDIATLRVSVRDIDQASSRLGEEIKAAMQQAAKNIEK
ncbi:MAG: histidinol dehydrogenase, partial [Enterobacterales bacterium]|nr:histidinol dehydrogenase [Enterobacterales bacterium]